MHTRRRPRAAKRIPLDSALLYLASCFGGACCTLIGSNQVQAQTAKRPPLVTFDITRTLELSAADGSSAHVAVQGTYVIESTKNPFTSLVGAPACSGYEFNYTNIKDGQGFCFLLRYVSGKMLAGEGVGQGTRVKFRYFAPKPGTQYSGRSEGMISGPQQDGSILIDLAGGPSFLSPEGPLSDAASLALACWENRWPPLRISYDDIRHLTTLSKAWTAAPFSKEFASQCRGTTTTEIHASGIQTELRYHETNLDVESLKYVGGTAVDEHVFLQGGVTWKEHGNFLGEVWVDGQNKVLINQAPGKTGECDMPQVVTSEYKIHRKIRVWNLDASGPVVPKPLPLWFDDNTCPVQDWLDNAEVGSWGQGPPDTWQYQGVEEEFLVEVQDRPECGCVYIAFAMQIKPYAYRIKYSSPEVIDKDEWYMRQAKEEPSVRLSFSDEDEWVNLRKIEGHWMVVLKP